MVSIPQHLIDSLKNVKGFDSDAFIRLHLENNPPVSIRFNPFKIKSVEELNKYLSIGSKVPWSNFGYYLKERPSFTFDPLFHAGCYYVQEASSMFIEQALTKMDLSKPMRILDLCAAPGGKSTHLLSLIPEESLLVSNEVIRQRSYILSDNIIKWGKSNVIITNNDPRDFKNLKSYFDILIIDAPCSGSGLFRKDEEAIKEWSLSNVQLCSQRQQRIIADALSCLKTDGLLIYATCSYSYDEDEKISLWLQQEMQMMPESIPISSDWNVIESLEMSSAYRFFPYNLDGEGFYLSCFRKTNQEQEDKIRSAAIDKATTKDKEIALHFLKNSGNAIIKDGDQLLSIPTYFINDFAILKTYLKIIYAGTRLGQVMKNKLIPNHALALSTNLSDNIPFHELSYDDSITYLQKKDFPILPVYKGWQTVKYNNHSLGWINALPNRINNYFPKELRILNQLRGYK